MRCILHATALHLALVVAVAAEGPTAPFDADDECVVGSGGVGGSCALNAMQLRARKQLHASEGQPATGPTLHNASLLADPSYDATCFGYTGGSCMTSSCSADREAQCVGGKCVCEGCAGPDGKCYKEKNKMVANGFVLRNAKYDTYKMYFQRASVFGQMQTTRMASALNMDQDKFVLYELPGMQNGSKEYFLGSTKWPGYVLGFKATTGTAVSPFGAYAVNLDDKTSLFDVWGPSNIMLRVCSMGPTSSFKGGVKIGAQMSLTDNPVWAYVHAASWLVYGSIMNPGDAGIWYPDPPLPDDLLATCIF